MEMKIISLVIAVFVGILLTASVLIPIIDDAQRTIGDEVVYTNGKLSANTMNYDYGTDVTIITTVDGDGASITLNGDTIDRTTDYQLLFLSDGLSIQVGSLSSGRLLQLFFFGGDNWTDTHTEYVSDSATGTATLEYSDGNGVFTAVNETEYTFTATWAIYEQSDGKFIAKNSSIYNNYTAGPDSDFVIYSGDYKTGELDTAYSYANGVAYCQDGYTMTVTYDPVLVSGTTDVYYHGNAEVTISDGNNSETFTPYRCLIPEKVIGHESGGAAYNLLGIIPLLVIISILVMITVVIVKKRMDE